MKYVFAMFCLFLTTCGNHDDDLILCTEQFVYGLNVTCKDASTNTAITEGLTVVAIDGNHEKP